MLTIRIVSLQLFYFFWFSKWTLEYVWDIKFEKAPHTPFWMDLELYAQFALHVLAFEFDGLVKFCSAPYIFVSTLNPTDCDYFLYVPSFYFLSQSFARWWLLFFS